MRFLSVCAGLEAISTAWHPLGFQAVAFSEIEPFPCAVLRHRYPDVPNLGDMTRYHEWPEVLLSRVDILVGGTPCQAFSVAGLRNSLADARGNLTLTFLLLYAKITAARHLAGRPAPLLLWENVPGVLNTPDNAFGAFLGGLAGGNGALQPPGGRWGDFGYVRGRESATAWRSLNAEHFGLAQRRKRLFLVHSPGGGPDPEKILFEFDGLRRDSAPGRQARQGPPSPALSRAEGRGVSAPLTTSPAADRPGRESLLIPCGIPDTARCVTTGEAKRQDWETCTILPCGETGAPIAFPAFMSGTAVAAAEDIAPALCAKNQTAVAFSGRARGDDGRGYDRPPQVFGDVAGCLETVKPHCVAYTLHGTDSTAVASPAQVHTCLGARPPGMAENSSTTVVAYDLNQVTSPGNRSNPEAGAPCHTLPASALPPVLALSVAFRGRDGECVPELGGEIAHALRAADGGANKPHVLAFRGCGQDGFTPQDLAPALCASDGGGTIPTVAHTLRGEGFDASEDGTGRGIPLVPCGYAVRRLTPTECEKLQGFPPGYTLIPGAGGWRALGDDEDPAELTAAGFTVKPSASGGFRVNDPDGPRYKALGNSMAVPVVRWIGERLLAAMLTVRGPQE